MCLARLDRLPAQGGDDRVRDREYRGETFSYDIWNGILFPTEYEYQESLISDFKGLEQHPVLKKWLYLPLENEDFEDCAQNCTEAIRANDSRFGIYPKMK